MQLQSPALSPPVNRQDKLILVQVLRGVASLAVLGYHVDRMFFERLGQRFLGGAFACGWAGVDLFFVLSGFILAYLYLVKPDAGPGAFLLRRFVRIYPIYWVVMGAVLVFFSLSPGQGAGRLSWEVITASVLLLPQPEPVLTGSWTLSYEVGFYLLFALVIWCKPPVALPLIAAAWLASKGAAYVSAPVTPTGTDLIELVFGDLRLEFCFGCVVAYGLVRYRERAIAAGGAVLVLGLGLLAIPVLLSVLGGGMTGGEPAAWAWQQVKFVRVFGFGLPAAFVLFGAAAIDLKGNVRVPFLWKYFGDASYSIYLVHAPVISALTRLLVKLGFGASWTMLPVGALGLGLGCACYSYIERPLLESCRKRLLDRH
ncbi:acyltransferase family protein [Gloeobacter violaceus]|uniref:Gll2186 protein n=1 Tax=Gloeobacter violaceus (strain ATCC 29082 / PCC 7421) TaxID=251221 RepID=Q7NIJ7_GLOVI|nr:acyltransferase [Gloeobacter violaceus]BAC90127.1 gll2186 [Gloeobacter violaceus PCC 7421]